MAAMGIPSDKITATKPITSPPIKAPSLKAQNAPAGIWDRLHCKVRRREPKSSVPAAGHFGRRSGKRGSDLQTAEIRHAGLHHVEAHFDVVVVDAAGFRGGEDLFPVQRILADGRDLLSLRGPALRMHRNETPGIFLEIVGSHVAAADGGNLKLEFDELGIEQIEQQVISA